eukprot:273571-Pelagomonas_calceolata.AAC.4
MSECHAWVLTNTPVCTWQGCHWSSWVPYLSAGCTVNAALGAVGKSYGGPGLQQVPGDALATLMLE